MKKLVYSIMLLAAVALTACQAKQTETKVSQPVKLVPHLYEITIDQYAENAPNEMLNEAMAEFACSSVRNGNFYGRNLDFFVNEVSEFIVKTPAKEGRHASIGVSRLFQMTDEQVDSGLSKEMIELIPWGMFDGINDAGLFCNVNVVSTEDATELHTSPNPDKPEICGTFLLRALLDNCANVDQAIEFINNHNVTGMNMGGFDLHYMIGDPDKTVVVEFIGNKVVVKEQNILTNFFVNSDKLSPKSDGVERYEILKANYAEGGESMQGMWNLMKRVRYSLSYDPETKPFWKTEFLGGNNFTIDTPVDSILADAGLQESFKNFKHYKETGEYKPEWKLWYTTHNSVYDIKARKLWITIREDYDHHYEFSLDK